MTTTLAGVQGRGHGGSVMVSLWRRALRAPLIVKVLGANLLIVIGGLAVLDIDTPLALEVSLFMALGFGATAALVWIALRPIANLEDVADRVVQGDWTARVPSSPIADAAVSRLAATMNRLLDRAQADRARIEYLAGRSVRARDIERESVARELRDSLAQMVSAIALGLAAARRGNTDVFVDRQLDETRVLLEELTDQMRGVAETLYPGTIAEFGLPNALRALARVTARRARVAVDVDAVAFETELTPAAAAALYRVADEALRNVVQHSGARHAQVNLRTDDDAVVLDVIDDGRGVDLRAKDPLQAGLGLFSARSVLALTGGELQISGATGRGTKVTARLPIPAPRPRSW